MRDKYDPDYFSFVRNTGLRRDDFQPVPRWRSLQRRFFWWVATALIAAFFIARIV